MNELKACPFCGGEARLSHAGAKHIIFCPNCVRLPADGGYINQEQAIAAWNNRADGWIKFEVDENGFLINIPVREKEVLVTDGKYTWTDIFINDGYEGCYFVSDYAPVDDVTHWRPLPEPPKGE